MNQPVQPQDQPAPPPPASPPPPPEPQNLWGQIPPPPVPLILTEQPVSMGNKITAQPGRVLLFSDDSGRLVQLPKLPKLTAWRYRWLYVVDVSDHFAALHLEMPSKSMAASFRLTVDVGWRVTDPARIVTSRIMDGTTIVRSNVHEALLPICRAYAIEQHASLEQNLAGAMGGGRLHEYPEGITLFRFSARVEHDPRVAERFHDRVAASHQASMAKDGIAGLRQQITSEADLILLSLQQNPGRVHEVIADIRARKEMSTQWRLDLFNKMVENDLIQEAEVDSLRQQILQPIGDIVGSRPDVMFGIEQPPEPARQAIDRPQAPADEEEEDVLPGEIVESSLDGVASWHPAPWQKSSDQDGA